MYVHVKPTRKLRVLSFILSIVLLWSAVMQNLVVFGVTITSSTTSTNDINKTNTYTSTNPYKGVAAAYGAGLSYKYTGNITTAKVDLYDYLSDDEVNGGSVNSKATNFTDPYTILNTAISNDVIKDSDHIKYAGNQNITIKYTTSRLDADDEVYAVLWKKDNRNVKNTIASGILMEYNSDGYFICTVNPTELNFTPDSIIFSENDNEIYVPLASAMSTDTTYNFVDETANKVRLGYKRDSTRGNSIWEDVYKPGTSAGYQNMPLYRKPNDNNYYYCYVEATNFIPDHANFREVQDGLSGWTSYNVALPSDLQYGWTYITNGGGTVQESYPTVLLNSTTSGAQPIYECKYTVPLYFGSFFNGGASSVYNDDNKADYQNFYWSPNMSQRSDGNTNTSSAVVQGLVDPTLDGGKLTQGGVELPYFRSDWHNDELIELYPQKDFPFYEVEATASDIRGYSSTGSGEKALFNQFYAANNNPSLYFTDNKFTETTTAIHAQGGKVGFFPFNDTDSYNSSTNYAPDNNLGFGAKFTINFTLDESGKVPTYKSNGDASDDGVVDAMFEFVGDDDVWIFIDGKLALDLGGSHGETTGLIDFAIDNNQATSYANYALKFGLENDTKIEKDNLGVANGTGNGCIGERTLKIVDGSTGGIFTTEGQDPDLINDNGTIKYTDKQHEMTIFYMERGMHDSNLLIRYNFDAIVNRNTLKVREVTDFTDVNEGLKSLTRQAADNDVFQYTVANSGTSNEHTRSSGIQTPTYDYYKRNNTDAATAQTAMLTGDVITSTTVTDTSHIYFDIDRNLGTWTWHDENAVIAAWMWGSSSSAANKLVKLDKVSGGDWLYRLEIEDYAGCNFLRLDPAVSVTYGDGSSWPSNAKWNQTGDVTLSGYEGQTYKIDSAGNNCSISVSTPKTITTYSDEYEQHNYTPGATADSNYHEVATTNYLWTDEYAEVTTAPNGQPADGIDGMTATTSDTTGTFPLMYGTNGTDGTAQKESSALFKYQFKTDSDMKVIQSNALLKPNNRTTAPLATHIESSGRNVNTYYTTTVAIEDAQNTINGSTHSLYNVGIDITDSSNYKTEFDYVNTPATLAANSKAPVEITETFTNTVNVGSISITKALDPNDDLPNREFEFQLILTKVFGTTGTNQVNVASDGYDGIKASLNGGTASDSYIDANGKFKLKKGQRLVISGIPVGTEYTIVETADDEYDIKSITKDSVTAANITGTISDNHTDTFVVTNARKVGSLTLSKTLAGESNAKTNNDADSTNNIDNDTEFTFHVTLTHPDGVTLSDYFTSANITPAANLVSGGTFGTNYTFDVKVKNGGSVVIANIPYGTTYSVTEEPDNINKQVVTNPIDPRTGTIDKAITVTNFTNTYRKITLTKMDSKDTSKKLSGARFVVLKVASDFDTTNTTIQNEFATATVDNIAAKLTTWMTSNYIVGYSSVLTDTDSNGETYVDDSMMTNGLETGYKYFFLELQAPNGYKKDSSYTSSDTGNTSRIYEITTSDTTYAGSINYYNERKTGKLVIDKQLATGSEGQDGSFTFTVNLDATSAGLNLNNYNINGLSSTSNPDSNTGKLQGTVTVAAGSTAEISGIPYGTTYSVTETSIPSGWVNVSKENETGEITHDTDETVTETATFTNAKTGDLVLTKGFATGTAAPSTYSFAYRVQLSHSSLDLTSNVFSVSYGSLATPVTNPSNFTVNVTNAGSVTINGIPYGTEYTVEEVLTEPQINDGWGIIDPGTNGLIGDSNTFTITNGKVGKLNLNKIITEVHSGDYKKHGVSVGDDFEFEVTLTNSNVSLSNVKVDGVTQSAVSGTAFVVKVPAVLSGSSGMVISNIPHGTTYTVTEVDSSKPLTGYGSVTGEVNSATTLDNTNDLATVSITNNYNTPPASSVSITLTKTDAETGAAITNTEASKRAKYVLLKLKENVNLSEFSSACAANKTSTTYTALSEYYSAVSGVSDEKTADENGKITLNNSDFVALGSVYPGDTFYFFETAAPEGYKVDNSYTDGKLITIVKGTTSYSVRYTDEPKSMDVNLLKTDDSNNPLAGAQFDLYFKESYNPPTNSINESEISPKLLPSKSINSTNTEPTPPAVSNSETISSTRYSYTAAEAPDASESTWILPRTENDYIYFRDYNISSSQYSGDNNGRWINTWFDTNEFGQSKEIFYDHRYWLKAVFTASGKETREYSVWERFVDHYDSKETVVWKIQPPDGYEYVEFILCDGANNNNHVRNTEKFKYVLGNIYTKTNKGKYDNGQYGYPVKGEHWSTYWDSAKHRSDPSDRRSYNL